MQPFATGNRTHLIILQTKNTQRKGWSDQDYIDAVKQRTSNPKDINMDNHQLRILWDLASFLFGDSSILPSAIGTLIDEISLHCITFKAHQINNPQFSLNSDIRSTHFFRWLQ